MRFAIAVVLLILLIPSFALAFEEPNVEVSAEIVETVHTADARVDRDGVVTWTVHRELTNKGAKATTTRLDVELPAGAVMQSIAVRDRGGMALAGSLVPLLAADERFGDQTRNPVRLLPCSRGGGARTS